MTPDVLGVEVARLSGKRPGRDACKMLEQWLLPEEPIVAGVASSSKWMPSWFLATPNTLLILLDRTMGVEISAIDIATITSYEVKPAWSGTKLRVGTTRGVQCLDQTDGDQVTQFVHYLERVGQELPGGTLPSWSSLDRKLGELLTSVGRASDDLEVRSFFGSRGPLGVACESSLALLCSSVNTTGGVTFEMSVVLLFLATNSGHPISEGRGALVRRLIEQAKPCTDSSILDAFERFGPQCPDLAQAVKHLSEVVTLFGELVPQDRPEVRSHYRNLATDIAAYAPENSAEASEDTGGQPSLDPIARLERLAAMRVAGHLDEEEFKRLKASVLNSLN